MSYIEGHEFGDKMVEDVAMILATGADHADMAAEELDKVIGEMEGFKEDLQESAEEYEEATDEADTKYMADAVTMLDEEMKDLGSDQPTQAGTVEPTPPVEAAGPLGQSQPPQPATDLSAFTPVPQQEGVAMPQPEQPAEQPMQQTTYMGTPLSTPQPPTF